MYYLNAGTITQDQDGLTPETGYHTMAGLLAGPRVLVDDDIVELVNNGVIDDSAANLNIPVQITVRSYSGNTSKPTWKIATGASALFFSGSNKIIKIYDIRVEGTIGASSYSGMKMTGLSTTTASEVSRCHFKDVALILKNIISNIKINITNNIFQDLTIAAEDNLGCINMDILSPHVADLNIANNVLNKGRFGICTLSANGPLLNGKWLNNICMNQGYSCFYIDTPDSNLLIDYNICFNYGAQNFIEDSSYGYVGSHNIENDPLLTDPTGDDFTLSENSPCIGSGIGHGSESSVPLVDYDNVSRADNADMGAYVKSSIALNIFSNPPLRNNIPVISTINASVLMTKLSGDSTYFTTIGDVNRVYLYFTHENGRQKKRLIHDGTGLSTSVSWSTSAKPGVWQLTKTKVFDREGAEHDFGRDSSDSDFSMI
jgi:hypothetical protein